MSPSAFFRVLLRQVIALAESGDARAAAQGRDAIARTRDGAVQVRIPRNAFEKFLVVKTDRAPTSYCTQLDRRTR
jgi:hypothetical protein